MFLNVRSWGSMATHDQLLVAPIDGVTDESMQAGPTPSHEPIRSWIRGACVEPMRASGASWNRGVQRPHDEGRSSCWPGDDLVYRGFIVPSPDPVDSVRRTAVV